MTAMRSILLAALLAIPLPLAAQTPTTDGFVNGAKLKELCLAGTPDTPVSSTFVCIGYIVGVVDSLAGVQAMATECLFVMPRDITTATVADIVKGYMRTRKDEELAKRRASDVLWDAVMAAWPCPKKP
jgi:Rap1a immunity proteins